MPEPAPNDTPGWSTGQMLAASAAVGLATLVIVAAALGVGPTDALLGVVPAFMLGGYVFMGLRQPGPWLRRRSPGRRLAIVVAAEVALLGLAGLVWWLAVRYGILSIAVLAVAAVMVGAIIVAMHAHAAQDR